MTQTLTPKKEILSIDIMKAICIIMVIINHAPFSYAQEDALFFMFYIDPAVPIFLIITGITYSMSCEGKISSISEWFAKKNFSKKLLRILPAYLVIVVLELIYFSTIDNRGYSPFEMLEIVLTGGKGPGSYYVVILFQLLFVFPLIYFLYKKSPRMAAIVVILVHLSFEILKNIITFPSGFYRLTILRYLIHILLGIFMYYNRDKLKGTWVPWVFFAIGFAYLAKLYFFGYDALIYTRWPTTAAPAALYAFGIFYSVMNAEKWFVKFQTPFKPLIGIGKASYHVFLAQMFYYAIFDDFIYGTFGLGLGIILSIAISVVAGYGFYRLESLIRKILQI